MKYFKVSILLIMMIFSPKSGFPFEWTDKIKEAYGTVKEIMQEWKTLKYKQANIKEKYEKFKVEYDNLKLHFDETLTASDNMINEQLINTQKKFDDLREQVKRYSDQEEEIASKISLIEQSTKSLTIKIESYLSKLNSIEAKREKQESELDDMKKMVGEMSKFTSDYKSYIESFESMYTQ